MINTRFRVWCGLVMSTLIAITLLGARAGAHEVQPAIADLTIDGTALTLEIRLALEAPLAGIDLQGLADTDEAAGAERYDALRALPPDGLLAELEAAWPNLRDAITIEAGGTEVAAELAGAKIGAIGNVELTRESVLRLTAALPDDDSTVTVGWAPELGALVLRQQGVEGGYTGLLAGGELSPPIPRDAPAVQSTSDLFTEYLIAGFEHIIPLGIDHILFVLGLFFFALAWGPLLWQVTAFTVAHTITLAMATLGVISIPDNWMWLVEAIIALSITYVAVENLMRPAMDWVRPAVVFGFGLLHGLGFASVLGDFGLPQGQFVTALLAFNIGVEIGQLAVIFVAFLLIVLARLASGVARLDDEEAVVRDLPVIYRAVSLTGSITIAIVGFYWFLERVGAF